METITLCEISKCCRTCLCESGSEYFISVLLTNEAYQKTYAELIMAITPVIINDTDPFSLNICQPCVEQICKFYKFQLKCIQADECFRKIRCIKNENNDDSLNIKLEPIDVEKVELQDEDVPSTTLENEISSVDVKLEILQSQVDNVNALEENKVQCHKCIKSFRTQRGLSRHYISSHSDNENKIKFENNSTNTLPCKSCTKSFRTLRGLSRHFITIHGENANRKNDFNKKTSNFQNDNPERSNLTSELQKENLKSNKAKPCTKRNISKKKSAKLVRKKRFLLNKLDLTAYCREDKPNYCYPCNKTFENRKRLLRHISGVHIRPRVNCDVCGKTFFNSGNLVRHKRSHSGTNEHVCEFCGKKYTTKFNLNEHRLSHTSVNTEYKCPKCEKIFISRARLRIHKYKCLNNATRSQKSICICDICNRKFSYRSSLWLHKQRMHRTDQNLQNASECDVCHRKYPSQTSLLLHKDRCHSIVQSAGLYFRCQICNKVIKYRSGLRNHMLLHSNEKPYKCQHCSMSFRQGAHLRTHVMIHTGEKPYKCEHCSKSFRHLTTLNDHTRIHTGEKPHHCESCGERFSHSSNLKKHMLKH